MTVILGLHFGHDAGVAVIRDGVVESCILRERTSRIKHVTGLDRKTIEQALAASGLTLDQVDFCGVCSTQSTAITFLEKDWLSMEFGRHPGHSRVGRLFESMSDNLGFAGNPVFFGVDPDGRYADSGPRPPDRLDDVFVYPTIDHFFSADEWLEEAPLSRIATRDLGRFFEQDHSDMFYFPLTLTIGGRRIPGYFIEHHYCHAAGAFYPSGFDEAAIFTLDGGGKSHRGYAGGMFYYGTSAGLFPLTPHHLLAGIFYEDVSRWLGFGPVGAPGKMMGLSGYGRPTLYDPRFVGNWYDVERAVKLFGVSSVDLMTNAWKHLCIERARQQGIDLSALAVATRITDPINVTIAASAQKVFEETILAAVAALGSIVERAGRRTENIVLSGGTALNVVANQRIVEETAFRKGYVPPGCDDSGLPIGAGLAVHHGILGNKRDPNASRRNHSPYAGRAMSSDSVEAALGRVVADVQVERPADGALRAAEEIAAGGIIAWAEGRSEIGPRALGHRSILADPRDRENWRRVNEIKGRELWRPLAPAVLESHRAAYFADLEVPSPYMSFNARVAVDTLPAVTHVDGSARIQSVDESCGGYFSVLTHFNRLTGCAVLMNTSFNGPGEPIIDDADAALRFLLRSNIDALYIDGIRITRARR